MLKEGAEIINKEIERGKTTKIPTLVKNGYFRKQFAF
jgi:hypothetical protein